MNKANEPYDADLEILAKMRAGVDYKFAIRCRQFAIDVRPLSTSEMGSLVGEIIREFRQQPVEDQTSIKEAEIRARITIRLASTSDIGKNDSPLTDYIVGKMTTDELRFLYSQYAQACEVVNPAHEPMPWEEIAALYEAVKKSPEKRSTLIGRSFSEIINLCLALLDDSQAAKLSGGPSTP